MSGKILIQRAIKAYLKAGGPDQPGKGSEEMAIDGVIHVVLRNKQGVLAVYQLDSKGILRRLADTPDGIV